MNFQLGPAEPSRRNCNTKIIAKLMRDAAYEARVIEALNRGHQHEIFFGYNQQFNKYLYIVYCGGAAQTMQAAEPHDKQRRDELLDIALKNAEVLNAKFSFRIR